MTSQKTLRQKKQHKTHAILQGSLRVPKLQRNQPNQKKVKGLSQGNLFFFYLCHMVHILGIRHHGVGSAKNVLARLAQLQPDMVLVEGAPELDAITQYIANEELVPPVAVLGYNIDNPQQATFYPFAAFSPEWQAIKYAHSHKIPVRMIDAPLFSMAALEQQDLLTPIERDPLSYFAELEGFSNSGAWWDYRFERQYQDFSPEAHFEAVQMVMDNLRQAQIPSSLEAENVYREAFMRQHIRQAKKEMYHTIVVVCGAWHSTALFDVDSTEKSDSKLLKTLPKTKIKTGVTWIPWTNARLSMQSGYGAGIASPGWNEYRWEYPDDMGEYWLTKVAQLFRQKNIDISTAHVIEAFRLTGALTAIREKSFPTLEELNEATVTVMCMGDAKLLEIVKKELIVGERIGAVPNSLPKHPLQSDFEQLTKKLRLPQTPEKKEIELDLRKELDLNRSILLYRLEALSISWGKRVFARSKGTFKEVWVLQWKPEMLIEIIERGTWGNTVELATIHFIQHKADSSNQINELAILIQQTIPAELFTLIESILLKINNLAAISADIIDLMAAVTPLVDVSRYGNVRKTDFQAVSLLVKGLIERICIGLPTAVYGLDEETAQKMFLRMRDVNETVRLLAEAELSEKWFATLRFILDKSGTPPLLSGCVCRLLLEAKMIDAEITATQMSFALSKGNDAANAAAWMEGFLKGSSLILLYDDTLWNLIYAWIMQLRDEVFVETLPILRRTFSKFDPSERRQLGEKAKYGVIKSKENQSENHFFDESQAKKGLRKVLVLLGLE